MRFVSSKEKIYKILMYGLTFTFMFVLQELIFSRHPLFGYILLPIPCAVIALSIIENAAFGVFFGLFCGLIIDVSSGSILFWYSVFLMIASYISGRVLTNWIRQNLPSAIILSVCCFTVGEIFRVIILNVLSNGAGLLSVFTKAIPSALLSAFLAAPFILLLHAIHRKLSDD